MNRVSIVNLAGRAIHVEQDGADAIDAWLTDAGARLASDPDRDELLADFERAIADKCEALAPDVRDVVSAADAAALLAALGTVEPAEVDPADAATTQLPRAETTSDEEQPLLRRRMYRIPDEEMIAGVAAGLAAWLRVDVTVVRVVLVLLAVLTGGAIAVAYIVLALVLPEAGSPEERARAHGYGATAQDIMARARDNAAPALSSIGTMLGRVFAALGRVLQGALYFAVAGVLALWLVAGAWVIIDGDGVAQAFDRGTSHWVIALGVTCIAWAVTFPLLAVAQLIGSWRRPRAERDRASRGSIALRATATGTWFAAIIASVLIPLGTSSQIRDIADHGRGRISLFDETYCLSVGDEYVDAIDGRTAGEHGVPVPEGCRAGDIIAEDLAVD